MESIIKPTVSVIVPAYNAGKWIKDTLESILKQTYHYYEVIVVDDCSTDNTTEIVNKFVKLDNRFKLYKHDINLGNASACNTAIENARGKYIALLGSDDLWEPNKLAKQIDALDTSGHKICITHAKCFGDEDLGKEVLFNQPNKPRHEIINRFFFCGNYICDSSALIAKEVFDTVGIYNPRFQALVDWDFWVRSVLKYDIFMLEEKLTKIRIRKDSSSYGSLDTIIQCNFEHPKIMDNFLSMSLDDFYKAIPNAENAHGKQADPSFVPIMLAAEAVIHGSMTSQVQWGLDVLYNELGKRPKEISDIFKFTYKDFTNMTRKMDIYRVSIANQYNIMKEKLTI